MTCFGCFGAFEHLRKYLLEMKYVPFLFGCEKVGHDDKPKSREHVEYLASYDLFVSEEPMHGGYEPPNMGIQ